MINSSEPNCQKIAKTNSLQKNNHYVLIITKIWYLKKNKKNWQSAKISFHIFHADFWLSLDTYGKT